MIIVVHYLAGNDISYQNHFLQKDYRNDIIVEIDGLFYDVYFFTRDSLKYEMRSDGFCSFPGMIILEEITNDLILTSISELADLGYFEDITGHPEMFYTKRFQHKWYTYIGPPYVPANATKYKLR